MDLHRSSWYQELELMGNGSGFRLFQTAREWSNLNWNNVTIFV